MIPVSCKISALSNSLGADMSTAGGNYGFITMSEFHEATINLKFKVLKCQPAPVSVTTKDLYASTASASTGKKNLDGHCDHCPWRSP